MVNAASGRRRGEVWSGVIVGVDVGGTFTDCIIVDQLTQQVRLAKVPSTPENQSRGLIHAVTEAWGDGPWRFEQLVHGTTVATNAVLERGGDAVAMIVTSGFRDVLEMRRRDRPNLYGLRGEYHPIVPRSLVFEVEERTDSAGQVETAVDREQLTQVAQLVRAGEVASVVVAFSNSYANPQNELDAVAHLKELLPSHKVVAASEISREYREFERTSTAVVSAYVQPLIGRYFATLGTEVKKFGYPSDVWIVQSNGGRMSLEVASEHSVNTILSGPAAGVVAAQRIAELAGFTNAVTLDMGGTSLDVGVIIDGNVAMTPEAELEFGIPLRIPMVDVHTVAAGGGSIASIDREGLLTIGPRSAGAVPGPAAYGRGGLEPTVTDANVVLGRMEEGQALGSDASFTVNRELAVAAMRTLSNDLPGSAEEIARSVLDVTVRKISDAVRLVTVERGLSPADFTLLAFGGAGALHVCEVMREVGLRRALVPRFPGLTSALGCVLGDIQHDFVQTVDAPVSLLPLSELEAIVDGHVEKAHALLQRQNVDSTSSVVRVEADMSYDRQTHTVSVPLLRRGLDVESIRSAFEAAYERRFGRLFSEAAIILVNVRTYVIAPRGRVSLGGEPGDSTPQSAQSPESPAPTETRPVYTSEGIESWPVVMRESLSIGATILGPALIQQADATCVVERGITVTVDAQFNLILSEG